MPFTCALSVPVGYRLKPRAAGRQICCCAVLVRTAGNAEHGWQVLLGADPSGLQFIADEEDWRETFELQHHKWSVQKGPQPTIFVREVISKTSESTVNVNRAKTAQQAADLSIQATP
eukprot:5145075-Prymnesium_polylepis.1